MRRALLLILPVAFLLCNASCKKKTDDDKVPPHSFTPHCEMIGSVHSVNNCTDSTSIRGSFDRISEIRTYNNCRGNAPGPVLVGSRRFIYDNDRVYIIDTAAFADWDTLIVDPKSLQIREIHRFSPVAGGNMISKYEYSAGGVLFRSITSFRSLPSDTTLYTFSGGDLVMQVTLYSGVSDTFRYSYYTDKPVPANGRGTQFGLRYGSAYIYRNGHLLRGQLDAQGRLIEELTYDYDDDGNISRVIRTTAGAAAGDTTNFHYICAVE